MPINREINTQTVQSITKTRWGKFPSTLRGLGERKHEHACFHEAGEERKVCDQFRLHRKTASEWRMGRLVYVGVSGQKWRGVSTANRRSQAKAQGGTGTGHLMGKGLLLCRLKCLAWRLCKEGLTYLLSSVNTKGSSKKDFGFREWPDPLYFPWRLIWQ